MKSIRQIGSPKLKEPYEDQDIETARIKDLIISDGNGEADPLERGEKSPESEVAVEREVGVLGEAAGEVDGSVGRLVPEYGEEGENEESETDVNGSRNQQSLGVHICCAFLLNILFVCLFLLQMKMMDSYYYDCWVVFIELRGGVIR